MIDDQTGRSLPRMYGVCREAIHVVDLYMPAPWHIIDTRDAGGDGWEVWDSLNRTVVRVDERELPLERMRVAALNAAVEAIRMEGLS